MRWRPERCKYGDMVRVRLGGVYHYGIFASEDEIIAFGLPPVPQYRDRPDRLTVCAVDVDTFCCGSILERAVYGFKEKRKKRSPEKTVAAARARLGEGGYNIIHNNCEHFANECVFGVGRCTVEEEARKRWLSRPICDVYVAAVAAGPEYPTVFPPERDREIKECRHPGLKAAKYADWELLALAAGRSLGVDIKTVSFKKTKNGRWEADGFDFSLSHTDGAVAVAVSNGAVGVDAESASHFAERKAAEREDRLRERFFTAAEREKYEDGPLGFLSCWTKKEAEFKRRAKGAFDPASVDTTASDAVTFILPGEEKTVISVSADNAGSLRFFSVESGAARLIIPEKLS